MDLLLASAKELEKILRSDIAKVVHKLIGGKKSCKKMVLENIKKRFKIIGSLKSFSGESVWGMYDEKNDEFYYSYLCIGSYDGTNVFIGQPDFNIYDAYSSDPHVRYSVDTNMFESLDEAKKDYKTREAELKRYNFKKLN